MDISSRSAEGFHTVRLPRRPLAPWLRLAHISSVSPEHASHQARLRVIHDFELVLQFEGRSWIHAVADGGSVDLAEGSVAFIPPGFPHGWASEPGRHIAVHFDLHAKPTLAAFRNLRATGGVAERRPLARVPRFALELPAAASGPGGGGARLILPLVTALRAPALWRERLDPLVRLWQRLAHRTLEAQLLFAETLGWALRTLAADAARSGLAVPDNPDGRILVLLDELERPGSPLSGTRSSVSELAARAAMGETAFRAAFLRATGRGPRGYLEERRIERAARALLETDRPVLEIARTEGYEDPYHFSRAFKRVTGRSPRAYRRGGGGT